MVISVKEVWNSPKIIMLTNCVVLYWWGGHCFPMHCGLFEIYCAPPNLGIRTWIRWLNLAQRPIFSGLRFFNEPEISDSGPPAKSPSPRTCAQDFYILKKIHRSQSGLNPQTLDLEASTLPRDHWGRLCWPNSIPKLTFISVLWHEVSGRLVDPGALGVDALPNKVRVLYYPIREFYENTVDML